MVKDAEANAEADRAFEELTGARNMAESMINATRKTLDEAGEKATDEEKAAIESAISEAETALKGDDKAADSATTKLTEASSSLAQKMYAEQAASGVEGEPQAQSAEQSGSSEDVVDAEFEEVKEENSNFIE